MLRLKATEGLGATTDPEGAAAAHVLSGYTGLHVHAVPVSAARHVLQATHVPVGLVTPVATTAGVPYQSPLDVADLLAGTGVHGRVPVGPEVLGRAVLVVRGRGPEEGVAYRLPNGEVALEELGLHAVAAEFVAVADELVPEAAVRASAATAMVVTPSVVRHGPPALLRPPPGWVVGRHLLELG